MTTETKEELPARALILIVRNCSECPYLRQEFDTLANVFLKSAEELWVVYGCAKDNHFESVRTPHDNEALTKLFSSCPLGPLDRD